MLVEQGSVIAVEADGVWVETIQKSSCDACSARSGCGQRLLADSVAKNMSKIKAFYQDSNNRIWAVGDRVEIGITEDALVSATLIVYFSPLVIMLVFAYLGSLTGGGDLTSLVGAIFGLAIGAGLARWHSFNHRGNSRFHAVVMGPSPTLHCS